MLEAIKTRAAPARNPEQRGDMMSERIRILFLSANPWTTSRILVDEEAREIFEKLQEGSCRDKFELIRHEAIRTFDLQRLLMMYEPHIVHFSGHASKTHKLILGGTAGRGKEVDCKGLVEVFALFRRHVRLILLNACFTRRQALALSEVIDYSVGTGKGMGDKGGVAFAGAFYRALGFGKSVKESFASAKAELCLTKISRTSGIELFVSNGISENDPFPQLHTDLASEAAYPWQILSNPLARQASDYEMSPEDGCFFHKGSIMEPQFPGNRNIARWYFNQTVSVAHTYRQALPLRGDESAPAPYPAPRGAERSTAALTHARETKNLKRADPRPSSCEIEPERSMVSAMTVKVERVLLMEVTSVSQTRSVQAEQAGRTRARSVKKRVGRNARCDQRRSD
jgi:hypothetical protein